MIILIKKTTLIKDYKEIHVELKIKHPCVMIIGETGVGKSQLCNLLSRSTTFPVSAESNSCTFQTTIREVLWSDKLPKYLPDEDEDEGENKDKDKDEDNKKEEEGEQDETDTLNIDPRIYENYAFTLLDAPGLSDSANKDSNHIQTMINKCKLVNKVSAFILVFNGKQPRLSSAVREMLKTFIQMFTKEYMNNIAVVFTNWSYDKKEIIKRKKAGMNEEKRKKDLTEFLIELGMPSFRDLPCFFIDSLPVGQNEAKIVYEELKKLRSTAFSWSAFPCDKARAVKSLRDQLMEEKAQAELQRAREEKLRIDAEQKAQQAQRQKELLKQQYAAECERLRIAAEKEQQRLKKRI